ncbi:MAG: 50S ribosomal protein L9 [Patescibacteria group bacterium]
MKIILLKDVPKIGKKYDVKEVADGYALNLLIPRELAVIASPQAVIKVEQLKEKDSAEKKIQADLLVKNLEMIKGLKLTLKEKANEKGHLFAGVTREVLTAEILKTTRLNLDPAYVSLEKPIKEVGEHKVMIEVMGKKAEFTVDIQAK